MGKVKAWWIFAKERFHPSSHLVMILVFLSAHVLVANTIYSITFNSADYLILLIGVVAFYFKLRLYDEVKDYELDVVINKTRPLPRGLLTHKDMYRGMLACIVIEILTFSRQGPVSAVSMIIAILYSLLMYKEFFIAEKIRPYLTTYALVHTIVTTLLSFAIFSYLAKINFWEAMTNPLFLSFALSNWLLFNIFEFGRKSYATSEERPNVDTYSSLFGRVGACALVGPQAVMSSYLSLKNVDANHFILMWGNAFLLTMLLIVSCFYIATDSPKFAKLYRMFSSLYIVLFFLILIFAHIIP